VVRKRKPDRNVRVDPVFVGNGTGSAAIRNCLEDCEASWKLPAALHGQGWLADTR